MKLLSASITDIWNEILSFTYENLGAYFTMWNIKFSIIHIYKSGNNSSTWNMEFSGHPTWNYRYNIICIKCEIVHVAATANSLQLCLTLPPHRQQPTRFPCPWDSPGKNTGVGCHFLLQCMKVKRESEVAQLCPTSSAWQSYENLEADTLTGNKKVSVSHIKMWSQVSSHEIWNISVFI